MLYIEKDEKVPLAKKYHKVNNICAHIYDQLTNVFSDSNYKTLRGRGYKIDKSKLLFVDKLERKEIHILEWLKANDLNKELTDILVKHLTMSILDDFVNFIYESLSCAKEGKMSVAYALLRKPFTDELLILEQLLYDPNEFIQRFYHSGDPSGYDPSDRNLDKKSIIKNAITKIIPNAFFTEDMIYDLRYNKESSFGINGMSNHALHIVTKDKNYKTTNQNFNFVFSNRDDINRYWEHYYSFVPYLLFYSVSIIDSIIFKYLQGKQNESLRSFKEFIRIIGLLLWSEVVRKKGKSRSKRIFNIFSNALKFNCPKCNNSIQLERVDFELFFEVGFFLCPKCFENLLSSPKIQKSFKLLIDSLTVKPAPR